MELTQDNYCFACGKENPIGLKMEFEYAPGEVTVRFTPRKEHQGWGDVVHGGILFTLMDEAMARMIIDAGDMVVTSRMEIKFLRPALVNEEIVLKGKLDKTEGKFFYTSSKILGKEGRPVAISKGVYVRAAE